MPAPHMRGFCRVTADMSFAKAWQSLRRASSLMAARYSSTLPSVSCVLLVLLARFPLAMDVSPCCILAPALAQAILLSHSSPGMPTYQSSLMLLALCAMLPSVAATQATAPSATAEIPELET